MISLRSASVVAVAASAALLVAGCSSSTNDTAPSTVTVSSSAEATSSAAAAHDHAHAGHNHNATLPAGLTDAVNPKFPVGTAVEIDADHMPGMDGAKGVVTGAYATQLYEVDYTPTTGGPVVEDHKWVATEELDNPPAGLIPDDTPVTITADHMEGMKGAAGVVVDHADVPVAYAVTFTINGTEYPNHLWVSEDELDLAK